MFLKYLLKLCFLRILREGTTKDCRCVCGDCVPGKYQSLLWKDALVPFRIMLVGVCSTHLHSLGVDASKGLRGCSGSQSRCERSCTRLSGSSRGKEKALSLCKSVCC